MKQSVPQNPTKVAQRRWARDFFVTMAAYVVVVVLSISVLKTFSLPPVARVLVAVTPGIPIFALIAALMRFLRSIDEMQRQIQIEALAVSAGITAGLGLTYGFLEGVGFPHISAFWACMSISVFWALSVLFIARRYKALGC